jgi:hypothetical protein
MAKRKPVRIEIAEEPDGRFLVRTFADGTQEREPIVDLPRKKRYPPRPYWHWKLQSGGRDEDE